MTSAAAKEYGDAILLARLKGKQALQELAEDHLPLVAAMVRRFPWRYKEKEELYQQGCIGLMKALARFDPSYGVTFSTYASAMILGEMRMLCRLDAPLHVPRNAREQRARIRHAQEKLTAHLGREPTISELAAVLRTESAELALLMENITVTSGDTPSGHTLIELLPAPDDWMNQLLLKDMISRLSKDDRKLLFLRIYQGKTQTETARALGISQVQVSRRESSLKQQLRKTWHEDT